MKTIATKLIPLLSPLGSWEASCPAEADLLAKQFTWLAEHEVFSGRAKGNVQLVGGRWQPNVHEEPLMTLTVIQFVDQLLHTILQRMSHTLVFEYKMEMDSQKEIPAFLFPLFSTSNVQIR